MNFDLITKLAKLANNNPNENEANLAARKVCKLLAEGNFQFNSTNQSQSNSQSQYRSASNPNDNPFADFFRSKQAQWEGFGKSPKQEKTASEKMREENERKVKEAKHQASWTYTQYNEQAPIYDDLFDLINKIKQEQNPFKSGKPFDINWDFDSKTGRKTRKSEERLLKCRSCGNSKLTKFVGLPELYECNTCQWTAYEKSTSKK